MAGTLVKWKGEPYERRVITKKDLEKSHNIIIDEDLVWERENGWAVDGSDFSDELIDVLKGEGGFSFHEPKSGTRSGNNDDDAKVEGNPGGGDFPATPPTTAAKKAASSGTP